MKLSFTHAGSSKLGGFILLLLSAFTLCSAYPFVASNGITSHSLGERGLLSARKLSAAVEDFKAKFESLSSSETISPGDCEYFDFTKAGPHMIGSNGFAGCVGLVVASARGAIVGHWTVTHEDMRKAEEAINRLWDKNKDDLKGATAVVYAEVEPHSQDKYVDEPNVNKVKGLAREITGIGPQMRHYIQPEALWVDPDGELLADADVENTQYGGLILENKGGGSANTVMSFVDVELQRDSAAPG